MKLCKPILAQTAAIALLVATPVTSRSEDIPPVASPNAACEEAVTVFHDISVAGRKVRAAENMTKRHAEMANLGFRFVDIDTYTENGDLQGFFVSYTRTAPCGQPGEANKPD